MSNHSDFFGCQHPIVCAAMNQVSNAGLAIAVHKAGAFPSLSIPNYFQGAHFDRAGYVADLHAYKEATGTDQLLLSVGSRLLLNDAVTRPFLDLGFRHIELFHWASTDPGWDQVMACSRRLSDEFGVKFIFKISTGHLSDKLAYPTLLLKGPDGAGRSVEESPPLDASLAFCRTHLPTARLIASGGIHGADQVAEYLSRGALAVAVGSLFAASLESPVADSVKQKIIASNAADLRALGPRKLRGLYASVIGGDNPNLTKTLTRGIKQADAGGIFMGTAVDSITEVLTVQQIVDRLVGK